MQEVKVGDVVHVKVTVKDPEPSDGHGVWVDVESTGLYTPGSIPRRFQVHRTHIVHVETRPLQVGDKVTWGTGEVAYELRTLVDDQAVLRKRVAYTSDVFEYVIRSVASLRIAERV